MTGLPDADWLGRRDLEWFLGMPFSRAAMLPHSVAGARQLLRTHGLALCQLQGAKSREAAKLIRDLDFKLGPVEDAWRLLADGAAGGNREAWATGRAESARVQLASILELPDTRCFHGARPDAHGFPYYPAYPVLVTSRKRTPEGGEGGAPPQGAA